MHKKRLEIRDFGQQQQQKAKIPKGKKLNRKGKDFILIAVVVVFEESCINWILYAFFFVCEKNSVLCVFSVDKVRIHVSFRVQ